MIQLKLNGCTRIVILIYKYAFKIPNFTYSMDHFLKGCCANWKERNYYKQFNKCDYKGNMVGYVAPSYFCSFFGLIQIQERCKPLGRDLTESEKEFYKTLCGTDSKKENFGVINGKIVCIDYE